MIHLRLKIRINLIGPIPTQSTTAGSMGLDAVMARTSAGHPYLPYSLVRGKLRQALEELADSAVTERSTIAGLIPFWFGPRQARNDVEMERGGLNFSDFVYPTPKNDSSTRTRIKIDSTTGAAQEKMMMVLDAPFQVGEPAKFVGEVGCICSTTVQAQATVKFVLAGLRWIRQIGAERTIGFGRVQSVDAIEIVLTKLLPPIAGTQPIHDPIEELFPDQRCRPTISHRCAAPAVTTADTKFVLRIQPHNPF